MELDKEKQQKAIELSQKLAKNFDEEEAEEFLRIHKGEEWYSDLKLLYEMITDKKFKLSRKAKIIIAGAIAYFVFPIDVIPDFIPIVGWLDDIFVLNLAIKQIGDEITRYKKFKGEKDGQKF